MADTDRLMQFTSADLALFAEDVNAGRPLAQNVQQQLVAEVRDLRAERDRQAVLVSGLGSDLAEISSIVERSRKRSA